MAIADPLVNPRILEFQPDEYGGEYAGDSREFDEKFMHLNLKKLLNVHSSNQSRWNIIHWIFLYPFVSKEFADPALRAILEKAASRCKRSGEVSPDDIYPLAPIERPVPSLGLDKVVFCVTREFEVVPYPTSFEATCLRLEVDPEDMRNHVLFLLRVRGIQDLIDRDEMAVKSKAKKPACEQQQLLPKADFGDPKVCVKPESIEDLYNQWRQELTDNSVDGQKLDAALDACIARATGARTSSTRRNSSSPAPSGNDARLEQIPLFA